MTRTFYCYKNINEDTLNNIPTRENVSPLSPTANALVIFVLSSFFVQTAAELEARLVIFKSLAERMMTLSKDNYA